MLQAWQFEYFKHSNLNALSHALSHSSSHGSSHASGMVIWMLQAWQWHTICQPLCHAPCHGHFLDSWLLWCNSPRNGTIPLWYSGLHIDPQVSSTFNMYNWWVQGSIMCPHCEKVSSPNPTLHIPVDCISGCIRGPGIDLYIKYLSGVTWFDFTE